MLEQQRRLGRRQVDRFGDQQSLTLQTAPEQLCRAAFVEDPLVQRVLVDHFQPVVVFRDQIAVVDLQGPQARRSVVRQSRPRVQRLAARDLLGSRCSGRFTSNDVLLPAGRVESMQLQPFAWRTLRRTEMAAANSGCRAGRPNCRLAQ